MVLDKPRDLLKELKEEWWRLVIEILTGDYSEDMVRIRLFRICKIREFLSGMTSKDRKPKNLKCNQYLEMPSKEVKRFVQQIEEEYELFLIDRQRFKVVKKGSHLWKKLKIHEWREYGNTSVFADKIKRDLEDEGEEGYDPNP